MSGRAMPLVVAFLLAMLPATASAQAILPTGFAEDVVVGGLVNPSSFEYLPDGRILIAEKNGVVRLVKNGVVQSEPFIDLRPWVNDYWDRGLLAVAASPQFASNGYVYLYYVYENDPLDYSGRKSVRLTRVRANGDTASPSTEVVILGAQGAGRVGCDGIPTGGDCIPADGPSHNGGGLRFASDGTIYLSVGDASHFNIVDEAALRAQDVDSLAGKLLHITPSGQGVASNPFWNGDPNAARSKVFALGVRNPFRLGLRPGTDVPYLGDVGWNAWEELDVMSPGGNYGWPCYEGPDRQDGFESKTKCQALYSAGPTATMAPLYAYPHAQQSMSVTAGFFYTGATYPDGYRDAYFFGDYSTGAIRKLHVDANDALVGSVAEFGSGLAGPVEIKPGPEGDLYYLAIITGELRRIRFAPADGATRALTDSSWTSMQNGWGPAERDRSNGEQGAHDGRTIIVNGRAYARGLGVHAASDVRFNLGGACWAFATDVGIDDEVGNAGSVVFQVWADGVKLYDSGIITGSMPGKRALVDIAGYQELALVVTDAGDGPSFDHADWAGATLECRTIPSLFSSPTSLPAGSNTHSVAASDLNGDSRVDLVAANAGSNEVSVWLGDGNFGFGVRTDYPVGRAPKQVAVGDVNKDGAPDLVSANQDSGTITVLIGTGGGTFVRGSDYPACSGAHEAAIGDLNADGSPDVVVACWDGSVIGVLRGRGDGTFAPPVTHQSGQGPHSIVLADFDADGRLDAAVANHAEATIGVLLGDGNGAFGAAQRYPVGSGPHSVRSGDFNGDGRLDLVSANDGSDSVSMLRGLAGGSFSPAVELPAGPVPKSVAAGDVNRDGKLDILMANTAGSYPVCCQPGGDTIGLLLGHGDGTFEPLSQHAVGLAPFSVAVADLDGDGDLDAAAANWHSNDVVVLRNIAAVLDPAPVITSVTAGDITDTAATITWTTDELADSQVDYGTSPTYGASTAIDAVATLGHSVRLSGLAPGTTYHYRVRSRDAGGNLAVTGDFQFRTAGVSPAVFISDLAWISSSNGWGPVERDGSNGEQGTSDGGPLTINGTRFAKGLGVHAASTVEVAVPTGCSQFAALAGIDDEVASGGTVVFQVWGDTTLLWQSAVLRGNDDGEPVNVSIDGRASLRLVVTTAGDSADYDHADWADAKFACGTATNTPPSAAITSPAADVRFKVGDTISFTGAATDVQDGTLAATSLSWIVQLHHCPGTTCHVHPFGTFTGSGGTFTVPDHGDNSFFEIALTARDSAGATDTEVLLIQPQTVTITLDTVPSGLQVVYGGVAGTAPFTNTTIVGSTHTVSTPSPQGAHVFANWSDGGAQQHNVVVGGSPVRLVAQFSQVDAQAPTVTSLQATTTATSITVTWTTSEPATGQVEYGTSNAFGSLSPLVSSLTTSHSITVSGVIPGTQYTYRVRSADAAGNLTVSTSQTVRTKKK